MTAINKRAGELANDHSRVPLFPMNARVVTGSDSDVWNCPVVLYVSAAGNAVVTPFGAETSGTDITFVVSAAMVANGPCQIPFCVKALKATNTTATGFLATF